MTNTNPDLTTFHNFITENNSIGIHAINTQGHTIIYNDKMKKIEGLALEDMSDRSILDIFRFSHAEESTLLHVLKSEKEVLNSKQTYWNQRGQEITTINDTYPVFEEGVLVGAIEFSRDITTLEKLINQPLQRYGEPITFDRIIAKSDAMLRVIEIAKKATIAKLPVLLIGESGTGKDLLAEGIHYEAESPLHEFIMVYCNRTDKHVIERLNQQLKPLKNCTIFCERIEYLSLSQQQQLVTLLEEFSDKHLFIASIGNDPINLIAEKKLSKELYYFFAALTISIPPLRDRLDDLIPFIQSHLTRNHRIFGDQLKGVTDEVEQLFKLYDWPGNLKEVEVLLDEVGTMISIEDYISYDLLPHHFKLKVQEYRENTKLHAKDFVIQSEQSLLPLDQYLLEAETYYLNKVLDMHNNNITKTAEALGMSRQNLQYRLRKIKST